MAGFESTGDLTGGIQATGNYPGKARNIDELRADILKALSFIAVTTVSTSMRSMESLAERR